MPTSSIYLVTPITKARYIPTEPIHPTARYFVTSIEKARYFSTQLYKTTSRYFVTPIQKARYIPVSAYKITSVYINTVPLDINDYPNDCHYPKELDLIRQKASVLIWGIVKDCLYNSTYDEAYGKENLKGYNKAGLLRLLLDYLSSVWMEKHNDSLSGLARPSDYYYTTYLIKDIITILRKCDLNVKDVVALFNLNSYTIIDNEWPNYFMMNQVINPPDEETQKQMKQYKDIYTTQGGVLPDSGQSIYNLSPAQSTFTPTKSIKYFGSFTINGVDYSGYIDYNANSVHYSPSALFGYTIQDDDIVTITYWYEE